MPLNADGFEIVGPAAPSSVNADGFQVVGRANLNQDGFEYANPNAEPPNATVLSPLQLAGHALNWAGQAAKDIVGAYAFEAVGDPEDQAKQLGISDASLKAAGLLTEPSTPGETPLQQGERALSTPGKVLSKAAYGLVETAPRLGAMVGAEAMGVPAPVAAGGVFGTTEDGFDLKQAAIAAALPYIGKVGGELTGAVAKKLGVTSTQAVNVIKGAGGMTGAAGTLAASDIYRIQHLPDDQRKDAYIDAVANVVGQSVLGPMGVDFETEGAGTAAPGRTTDGKVSEFGGLSAAEPPAVQTSAPAPEDVAATQPEAAAAAPPGAAANVPAPETVAAEAPVPEVGTSGAPVQRVNAEAIATRPDLMQFKQMDDPDTGTNAGDTLSGKWDDLKGGNLLLWEPKDPAQYGLKDGEKYIVANGHHRFEFGDENDVPAYNAQVIREADGYSAGDARSMAAEINIADGKGTVYDATKFLRNESATHGPDAALARGEQIGVKGGQAATIAFKAGGDLYASFVNEQIKPEQAEALARSAPVSAAHPDPVNESLQRQGIKDALAGESPQALANLTQAYRLEMQKQPAATQLDMFGGNDAALNTAKDLAKVASRIQNELSREIRSTDSAARNAATAKAKGITFERNPQEILAENARLKGELDKWQHFGLHPELIAQLRGYADMKRSGAKAEPSVEEKLSNWADEKIAAGKKRLNVGLDPELLAAYSVKGALILKQGLVDFGKWSAEMVRQFGEAVRPHLAVLYKQSGGLAEGEGLRQFGQALQQDPQVAAPVKEAIGEYSYQVGSHQDALTAARKVIAGHGVDAGIAAYQNPRSMIPEDVRSALGSELIHRLGQDERLARSQGKTAEADIVASKQVAVSETALRRGTELGKGLSALKIYGAMTPDGFLRHAQQEFGEAGQNALDQVKGVSDPVRESFRKANADALQGTLADPRVNDAARAAVNEQVAKSPDTHRGVVVEVTGAMADSPEVMRQARAALAGRLNEILQPRAIPLGKPASAELRAIMDDLAKRAAGIAASHYQGAELGKPLGQKFQDRLGLSKPAADRLAKAMENTYTSMVKKAQERIPWRIANQRAKLTAPYDPNETNIPAVDREIRRQLQAANVKLGALVQQHAGVVDAAGRTIAKRVVADSGLTGPKADALKAVFNQRFEELATAQKRRALEQLAKAGVKLPKPGMLRPDASRDLIQLTNLGAFTDAKFDDLIRKRLDVPVLTPELKREIMSRANALQQLPEGFQRDRAATKLLDYVSQQRGTKWWELASGVWYANVLSHLTVPVHIMLDNLPNLAMNTVVAMVRHPGSIPDIPGALARGFGKGLDQAREVLKTGVVTGVNSRIATSKFFERDPMPGKLALLNQLKYVGRVLSATHVLTFKPAVEMKQALLAREAAQKEGLAGQPLEQRVANILGNTEAQVDAAKAQAATEGLTGLDLRRRTAEIIEQQREAAAPGITESGAKYGRQNTYLNEPYGVIGMIGKGIDSAQRLITQESPATGIAAQTMVPFKSIVGNLVNEKLNYSPVGALRAIISLKSGKLYGEPVEAGARGDLVAKAVIGTAAMGAVWTAVANGKLTLTGNGPKSAEQRRQLEAADGWRPNSIKVGNAYVSYLRTPLATSLSVLGNYLDAEKYGEMEQAETVDRATYAAMAIPSAIVHQSFLKSVGELLDAVQEPDPKQSVKQVQRLLLQNASGFAVPGMVKDIDRIWDPAVYSGRDIAGMVRAQIPFARRNGKPVINALGEPVNAKLFNGDFSSAKPDPLWTTLTEKQAWVPAVPSTVIIGNKKDGPDNYRALTPDEIYDYTVASGQKIRERLEARMDDLQSMDTGAAKKLVDQITEEERKAAKESFR